MVLTNCAQGTLNPYSPSDAMPWNAQRAAHLLRRAGFGGNFNQRLAVQNVSPTAAVNSLISTAMISPLSEPPVWANWNYQDYDDFDTQATSQFEEWLTVWMNDLLYNPLRGKMTLFWSNHFVTESQVYDCPSYLFQYHRILQDYALGNLKDFVHAIGLTPAMLVYLNGAANSKEEPNENYARELYELFTLGADNNYTQTDIEETARALTGYTSYENYCGSISFDPNDHDNGTKTIFGQTGNWDYDDVIDILFEQRSTEIASFICEKFYKFFVHPEPVEEIVSGLAATLIASNWEIEPVMSQLLRSEHFFDQEVMNTIVRSPYDLMLGIKNEIDYELSDPVKLQFVEYASYLGQTLSSPINVAGWQGNRTWISTNLLTARWQANSFMVFTSFQNFPEKLTELAVNLAGSETETDPDLVTQLIIDYLIPGGLTDPTQYERANVVFRAEVPEYYYTTNQWNLAWESVPGQVGLLLDYIGRMPEVQLM